MRLLLLSNSVVPQGTFLGHAMGELTSFLRGVGRVLFVPYAKRDHDGYLATVRGALEPLGLEVTGIHQFDDPVAAVREAEAVFVGGGNSFRLLNQLWRHELVEPLRSAVANGAPYIGSSAGTNMAQPSLRTTNDMPIVQPPTFEALGLVPFQINPHYLDPDPGSRHMGETREERVREFLEENDTPVLGLREGSWLRVAHGHVSLGGDKPARLFQRGTAASELPAGEDISFLLSA